VTGRARPEWIGRDADSKPPVAVRLRVFERYGGKCYLSGRKITPGDEWHLDHIKPLHLGGANAESNLAPVLADKHREKSAAEVSAKAKADRVKAKHLRIWPKSRTPLRSRGFPKRRQPIEISDA
jgi:5-methylcytosine-specific restriction protein A